MVAGTAAYQDALEATPINPFSAVTVADIDQDQIQTATVTFDATFGILSNDIGTVESGRYTVSGTPAQVEAALQSLAYTPATGLAPPGQSVMTDFDLAISDGFTTTFDLTTSVATSAIACFVSGNCILTDCGEVHVETLAIGDIVMPGRSGSSLPRRVIWIGRRHIDCSRHPNPTAVWPIRVTANAFGEGLPVRDLYLSPEHAIYWEGTLLPIKELIDGQAVAQIERDCVTYWHVELDAHDVLLAEGLPAESYLANGNREEFGEGSTLVLYPAFKGSDDGGEPCVPVRRQGVEIEGARRFLADNRLQAHAADRRASAA